MQTLTFHCSHCGGRMGVGMNLAGRNVRCPHCKKVVSAPMSAAAIAATPVPAAPVVLTPMPPPPEYRPLSTPSPAVESDDSIFGETVDEDLFGTRQPTPKVPDEEIATPSPDYETLSEADEQELPAEKPLATMKPMRRPEAPSQTGSSGAAMWLLLTYSLAMTAAAAYLAYAHYMAPQAEELAPKPSYLAIPDFFGQYDKAERRKVSKIPTAPDPNAVVPQELRIPLNKEIALGQLRVTPLEVSQTHFQRKVVWKGKEPEPFKQNNPPKSMQLKLLIKNTSVDQRIVPTDPAFQRAARPGDVPPYQRLIVGPKTFVGGIVPWPNTSDPRLDYEFVHGQEDDGKPLEPGEERQYLIVGTADSKIDETLRKDPNLVALWQVQLRSGLVDLPDLAYGMHSVSMTSVFGVEFMCKEVK